MFFWRRRLPRSRENPLSLKIRTAWHFLQHLRLSYHFQSFCVHPRRNVCVSPLRTWKWYPVRGRSTPLIRFNAFVALIRLLCPINSALARTRGKVLARGECCCVFHCSVKLRLLGGSGTRTWVFCVCVCLCRFLSLFTLGKASVLIIGIFWLFVFADYRLAVMAY